MNFSENVVNVFPQIFKRPFIPIVLDTPLYQFSVFLAIGPEIYVDGLVVLEKNNQQVVGRLGSKNILSHLLNTSYSEWRSTTADQIMERSYKEEIIDINSPVSRVIELFKKTKLAFTPITKDRNVVAILTIRDFLPIVMNKNNAETTSISHISSKLTSIDKNTDVLKAIDIMLKKGIRNIGMTKNRNKPSEVIGVINDRKILEFLLSYTGRQIMKDLEQKKISHIRLIRLTENLDIYPMREVPQDISIKVAAKLLTEMERPFLILEGKDKIVTPWDIVMKTF
ncbi:MAG TPA: CBS domain-containing protein [Nitrososphaeraceae archaeon]|jgi:CBS domain-containing protein|nr:CBS domain-containing protein [Nitrososphaeraceae archaeon]